MSGELAKRVFGVTIGVALVITAGLVGKYEPASGARMYRAIVPVPGDPWTICYGHTLGVHEGDTATPEQCEEYRKQDILIAYDIVARCIHWPLTSNQLGAFGDATFNLGPAVVCGSTLQRRANAGDIKGACTELANARNGDGGRRGWSFAGGIYYPGLYRRRVEDGSICWPSFANVQGGTVPVVR